MSILASASRTRRDAPIRAVIHGLGGVGKSTFAASAPSPVFIAAEDGLMNIDAVALPEPKTWAELLAQVDALRSEEHDYRTLVIDSLDWAEPLCWGQVCARGGKRVLGKDGPATVEHIEAFGYGKGYVAAVDEWRVLLSRLDRLRERGMHIVLIAHSARKPVKNPTGEDYDAWVIKLHEKSAGKIIEWADVVGFATHDIATSESNGRHKAVTTGERVLYVQPNPAFDSKTRLHLPPSIPLEWSAFMGAIEASRDAAAPIKKEIEGLVKAIADVELAKKVEATVASANGNATRLAAIADRLRTRINAQGAST